jgi:tetratricopeptide (TPR) repeat protein
MWEGWKKLLPIALVFLFLFTFKPSFGKSPAEEVYQKLQYQIEIKDFLGAKLMAEKIFKRATDPKSREVAYILYWEASGYLHYKKGEFNKILEDIGGLNLYWSFFREKRYYEDLYFEALGKLYTLLFQYRRAVIFFIQSYKMKPSQRKLLEIIYATEMAYYNEIRPYLDYSFIEILLKRVKEKELNVFEKALYQFEIGFYNLLIGNYKTAYEYFQKSFDLDKSFLTEGQAAFFMGKALEGAGDLKRAYFYYKKALSLVKHPIYRKNVLFRLFVVSAKLKFYSEANGYYLGLARFGGIAVNPYLQEATLLIPDLGDFKNHFYWRRYYDLLVAKIMWLNINNERGRRAFLYFLKEFLAKGKLHPEFVTAWKVLYPHEVKGIKIAPEKVLSFGLERLEKLEKLYTLNPQLFKYLFGDYGYLALAKYYFLKGAWKKAEYFAKKAKLNLPYKYYIIGVIEAYRGNPYPLESYYSSLNQGQRVHALFWLGWGYLLNNRWDLTSLYWEDFLKKSSRYPHLLWERVFSSFYLANHYEGLGLVDKALHYYTLSLKLLNGEKDFKGLKRYLLLKLATLSGKNDIDFNQLGPVDNNWQKFLKYLLKEGGL